MPRITDRRPTRLSSLAGLSADEVKAFQKAGITDNEQLLARARTRSEVTALAKTVGLSTTRVKEALNRADLVRLDGLGPATANLFESAGVNSVKELATRNPVALHRTLAEYARRNPALHVREPSQATVRELVSKAAQALMPAEVVDAAAAERLGAEAMRAHVEGVLFSQDPAGAEFRRAVLEHRPAAEWPAVKTRMLGEIAAFFASADKPHTADAFTFVGSWLGLYTELSVTRAGAVERLYVEID